MLDPLETLKDQARQRIEGERETLLRLSHDLHAEPELAWEEYHASSRVADALDEYGYDVRHPAYEIPTAVEATKGRGASTVAICAEYDALPGIGHACGHNVIAAAAVGAALGLAAVLDDTALTVRVLGTPAEEVGNASGKILLLERGAFDSVGAAMMIHPGPFDIAAPVMISAAGFQVRYTGKEAHAAAFPHLGVNAADAMVVAQVAIGLLRQHIEATDRVHGIVTAAGVAPNVIPAESRASYMVRSTGLDRLEQLRSRVFRCFEAGELATGAKLRIEGGDKPYAEVRHDPLLVTMYQSNALHLGRVFPDGDVRTNVAGSTDLGNVSLVIPSIHPFIGIGSWPVTYHQPEFAQHCVTADADRAVIDGAVALAWTAIDWEFSIRSRGVNHNAMQPSKHRAGTNM